MKWDRISRRHFLQGAGGFTLALPFLPSILGLEEACAQALPQTKRFIGMMSPHGALWQNNWYGQNLPSTPRQLYANHIGYEGPLTPGSNGAVSPVITNLFDSQILSKINLIKGVDFPNAVGHHNGGALGNYAASAGQPAVVPQTLNAEGVIPMRTIDQIMGYSSKIYPSAVFTRVLKINAHGGNSISYGLQDPNDPTSDIVRLGGQSNPLKIYNSIFGISSGNNSSVVDRVFQDYQSLRNNSRMGSEDRQKVDSHMTFLSELRTSLTNLQSCSGTSTPPANQSFDSLSGHTEPEVATDYRLINDVIAAAIRCGSTKIVTMNITFAETYSAGGTTWHQDWAHTYTDPTKQAELVEINRWIAEVIFLDLIRKLDVPEANGRTYLDNSLVTWIQENGYDVHSNFSMPIITAGSAGGFLRTGLFMDYTNRVGNTFNGRRPGIFYSQFLVTCLQALGLVPADYERLDGAGNRLPGYGYNSLRPADSNGYRQFRMTNYTNAESTLGDPLPFLVS